MSHFSIIFYSAVMLNIFHSVTSGIIQSTTVRTSLVPVYRLKSVTPKPPESMEQNSQSHFATPSSGRSLKSSQFSAVRKYMGVRSNILSFPPDITTGKVLITEMSVGSSRTIKVQTTSTVAPFPGGWTPPPQSSEEELLKCIEWAQCKKRRWVITTQPSWITTTTTYETVANLLTRKLTS